MTSSERGATVWHVVARQGLAAVAALAVLTGGITAAGAQAIDPATDRGTPGSNPAAPGGPNQFQQNDRTGTATSSTEINSGPAQPIDVNGSSGTSGSNGSNSNAAGNSQGRGSITQNSRTDTTATDLRDPITPAFKRPPLPSAFELFVAERVGRVLPRFGADLIVPAARDFAAPPATAVPSTYVLQPGDQIFIGLSGSLDGSVKADIDNNGRIFLPKVGMVKVGGATYGDLKTLLANAIGLQYRGFNVSVSITSIRGFRVYVTGFANNPGGYSVNSLSTLINAVLAAGGPSAGGSFRSIKLYRNGEQVSDFDLYDFLRSGDKSKDVLLHSEDVLFIPPVGEQAAIAGSVNQEAIYEARPGETISDLVRYAGGATALADQSRVIVYKLANQDRLGGVEVARAALGTTPLNGGDIVQVLTTGSLIRPLARETVLIRIDGEVNKPGNYFVPPGTSLDTVIGLAGGLTPGAFVFGTRLQRLSVRTQQRRGFEEALSQLEVSLAAAPLSATLTNPNGPQQYAAARATLDRLRVTQPDGRVVLPMVDDNATLPAALALENNDTLYIPPRPSTVGVFGAVYRPASFLIEDTPRRVRDYLDMAGGSLRAADNGQVFLVRANGAVVSKKRGAMTTRAMPGDVVFVPIKTQNNSLLNKLGQIATLVFGLGLSAASIVSITR